MKFKDPAGLTAELARTLLHYEPATGVFTRRSGKFSQSGCLIRRQTKGYRRIRVGPHILAAHRVAWLYVYGEWPNGEIDHINGDRSDNRLTNLRCVSHAVNMQNLRKALRTNKTGLLGAHPHRASGKFQAQITLDGRIKYLGVFATAEEAHAIYLEAKRRSHEGCSI